MLTAKLASRQWLLISCHKLAAVLIQLKENWHGGLFKQNVINLLTLCCVFEVRVSQWQTVSWKSSFFVFCSRLKGDASDLRR